MCDVKAGDATWTSLDATTRSTATGDLDSRELAFVLTKSSDAMAAVYDEDTTDDDPAVRDPAEHRDDGKVLPETNGDNSAAEAAISTCNNDDDDDVRSFPSSASLSDYRWPTVVR